MYIFQIKMNSNYIAYFYYNGINKKYVIFCNIYINIISDAVDVDSVYYKQNTKFDK